ncbi:MAG: sensor domain-containing diguanylate cyclase [Candidatus Geothermincolia bacterium]
MEAASDLVGLLSKREAAEQGLQHLLRYSETPGAVLYLAREGRDDMVRSLYRGVGLNGERPHALRTAGIVAALETGRPFSAGELPRSEPLRGELRELEAGWCAPLAAREGIVGMVCFAGDAPQGQRLEDLVGLASLAANAMQGAQRYEQALYDEASGLYSSRLLQLRLREELRRAIRYGRELALVLLAPAGTDAAKGTSVTRDVGEALRAAIRADVDVAARYGEGEVGLMLPDTGRQGALVVAGRLCDALGRNGTPGVGIGVAAYPDHGDTPEELTEAAEAALRRAVVGDGGGVHVLPPSTVSQVDYRSMRRDD